MLTITEAAEEKIAELISESEKPVKGLRIGARLDAAQQVDYKLAFVSDEQLDDEDEIATFNGFDVYIAADSADLLLEAKVDYVDGLMGAGFKIESLRKMPVHLSGPMAEAVHKVIEEKEIATESAEITALPELSAPVAGEKEMEKVNRLVDLLDDHDDVQAVYSNAELG